MGHIREPKGVDFIISGGTLSDKDKQEISLYIKEYKQKHGLEKKQTKRTNIERIN